MSSFIWLQILSPFGFVFEYIIIREGNGNPLQYSCLENPMEGGAWWAAVHGVAKSRKWLNDFTFTFHFHALEKEMTTHSSVLAWRISGMEELGRLLSMGSHRVGHNWSDLAAAAARVTINFQKWMQQLHEAFQCVCRVLKWRFLWGYHHTEQKSWYCLPECRWEKARKNGDLLQQMGSCLLYIVVISC